MGDNVSPVTTPLELISSTHVAGSDGAGQQRWEEEKAAMRRTIQEQESQISKLCKEVAFLRLGFTRLPDSKVQAAGYYDWTVKSNPRLSYSRSYERGVHRCVLASKSPVMQRDIGVIKQSHIVLPRLRFTTGIGVCSISIVIEDHVYDAFIDYFFTASVSTSNLEVMWANLLFLALYYDVAELQDDCLQYMQGSHVDLKEANVAVAMLGLGLEYNWKPLITRAIGTYLKHPSEHPSNPGGLLDLDDAEYKQLAQRFPHIQDLISQALRSKRMQA